MIEAKSWNFNVKMRNREFEFLKRLNEFLEQPNLRLPELYGTSWWSSG